MPPSLRKKEQVTYVTMESRGYIGDLPKEYG